MTEHFHFTMDRNIFNLKLSVEATSAYILVASSMEENVRPSLKVIKRRWVKSDRELDEALGELMQRNVLQLKPAPDGEAIYYPNPASLWR